MEYFLSELGISSCIQNGQLEYDLVFTHPYVINYLCYAWLYNEIFGIYPSKLDIPHHLSAEFKLHISYITKNTLAMFLNLDFTNKQSNYVLYKTKLTDKAFVKRELFLLLADRVQCTNVTYNPLVSLWKNFQNMFSIDIKKWYNSQDRKVSKCPYTNMYPNDLQIKESAGVLTETDIFKHIIGKNYFFLLQLYSQKCIIMPKDCDFKSPFPAYIIKDNFKYLHCIPKICSECIIIAPTSKVSLAPPAKTLHIDMEFNEAFSFYATTRIKEFLNIPRSINIPSRILEIMFKKYKLLSPPSTTPNSKATVLIIDNRDNIISVIAGYITLSYLQPKWSVTIVTSPKQYEFYRKYFPFANLVSHPLQEKSPFDMEDYNTMLKSPSLWKLLDEKNITTALLIQDDGFIIRPGMESKFLDEDFNCLYTYVGAPWQNSEMLTKAGATTMVGNGGLSLRDVGVMLEITQSTTPKVSNSLFNNNIQPLPEDVFFAAEACKRERNCPKNIATLFASEMILNEKSFGIHKPWGYFSIEEVINTFFKEW